MDRRSVFFTGAAIVSAVMIPLAPSDLRWVPAVLALTYVILTLLSLADYLSRTHDERKSELSQTDR